VDTRISLITAAGGNGTAIQIIDKPLTRAQYEHEGKVLGDSMEPKGAEQAGFLVLSDQHFEMAGGEFCGNATRSAAVLFSNEVSKSEVSFTVSGFDGTVRAHVQPMSDNVFDVRCEFPSLPVDVKNVTLLDGQQAAVVDLGGIVHVVIEGAFPSEPDDYTTLHRRITDELGLGARDAVGVIWYERQGDLVLMHPVVWVKAIDTFFYETSCGSGTIAVGKVTGVSSIVQPTEKMITVEFTEGAVVLKSEMEIVN
jgi:diaminopimelate epimerase